MPGQYTGDAPVDKKMNYGMNDTTDTTVRISVLVPVYNVEGLLPRCLDSMLRQTINDIEIVCVNDASPDKSGEILQEYARRDPRVRIITKPQNEGLMMARKTGYENARGEYLFFCDSDDFIPDDALEKLYRAASETGADITVGAMYLSNDRGKTSPKKRGGIDGKYGEEYLRGILSGVTCSLCGSLFHRRLFDHHSYVSYMNQTFSEDRLLLTQILLKRQPSVATIPDPTYFYWINTQSITRKQINQTAVTIQLTALFRSHAMVEENCPKLRRNNDAFIIRYMSYYLEQVPWRRLIRDFNSRSRDLLKFSIIKNRCGLHLAVHTLLLLHIPFYRHIAWAGRSAIRKIQGKI